VVLREVWTERLRAFAASGLSRKEFCAAHGFHPHTLTTWKRRLGWPSGRPAETGAKRHGLPATPQTTFVPVRITAPVAANAEVMLRIGDRAELALPASVDPSWLAAVLRGLL
jgi:hypothetical protein